MQTYKITSSIIGLATLLLIAVVAGCGGSGNSATTASGGSAGSSTGTVTAFGSVYVNGVKYDTSGVPVRVNGNVGSQADLSVGDVVTVIGTSNGTTGTATSIEYWADVEGPISAIGLSSLTVLGQNVIINGRTVFDNLTGLSDLSFGNVIEVSGFRDGSGAIVASRIERKSTVFTPSAMVEVKGVVSNLNATAGTFNIGTLVVNTNVFLPVGLVNGATVEVKGTVSSPTGSLNATYIEVEDSVAQSVSSSGGSRAELEGYITDYVSVSNFKVGGQQINAVGAMFENGSASNLANGVKVEVEGSLIGNTFNATKVEVEDTDEFGNEIETEGSVQAITASTITINNQTFSYNAQTQMEDETNVSAPLNMENIMSRIMVNSYASVEGYLNSSGALIATRIEIDNDIHTTSSGTLQ